MEPYSRRNHFDIVEITQKALKYAETGVDAETEVITEKDEELLKTRIQNFGRGIDSRSEGGNCCAQRTTAFLERLQELHDLRVFELYILEQEDWNSLEYYIRLKNEWESLSYKDVQMTESS